ncbi:cysteine protease domain containing protein, putative [Eimeria tenella]|uniref:Ubiquitin thioesterase OTU n=1 Tax=Eimeria tenella TaxID=5802 RepID=U6KI27_EIMTE|nr:cysteine protease domain containing protein, putative [Eimeria tenella]CDJ37690.1 cysteine protease domain containing protein, putative [Eimeria tenella]|eukprot:XP_013228528.1 cysteine protease domain containing protein, putative [Eimeria tenella]
MEEAEACEAARSFVLHWLLQQSEGSPQEAPLDFAPISFHLSGFPLCLRARQSPGAGDCLFVSVAAALWQDSFGYHPSFSDEHLQEAALSLRQLAVNTLEDPSVEEFVMEGAEKVGREELLQLASLQYNCSAQEYCRRMRMQTTWGGGPEILSLAHALRRPIAVYTLQTRGALRRTSRRGAATDTLQQRQQQTIRALLQQQQQEPLHQQLHHEGQLHLCKVFGWTEGCKAGPLHLLFTNAQGLKGSPPEGEANHFAPLFPVSR